MIHYLKNYIFFTLATTLLYCSCSIKNEKDQSKTFNSSVNLPSSSIYNLDINLYDQNGKTIKWESLKGKLSVISMIFTSCKNACPMIVENLKNIQKEIHENVTDVQFILISFDPNDTPSHLLKFSKENGLDTNWTLLTGKEQDIRSLSMLLDITYQKVSNENFSHSNAIIILDPLGNIIERSNNIGQNGNLIQILKKDIH